MPEYYELYKTEEEDILLASAGTPEKLFWYLRELGVKMELKDACEASEELREGFLGAVDVTDDYRIVRADGPTFNSVIKEK